MFVRTDGTSYSLSKPVLSFVYIYIYISLRVSNKHLDTSFRICTDITFSDKSHQIRVALDSPALAAFLIRRDRCSALVSLMY